MVEEVPGLSTLEARIRNEFKQWPKDAVEKLKVEIQDIGTGKFTVGIERNIEESEEAEVFRAQHNTKFQIGVFDTEEEAQKASLQAQSILAKLG